MKTKSVKARLALTAFLFLGFTPMAAQAALAAPTAPSGTFIDYTVECANVSVSGQIGAFTTFNDGVSTVTSATVTG